MRSLWLGQPHPWAHAFPQVSLYREPDTCTYPGRYSMDASGLHYVAEDCHRWWTNGETWMSNSAYVCCMFSCLLLHLLDALDHVCCVQSVDPSLHRTYQFFNFIVVYAPPPHHELSIPQIKLCSVSSRLSLTAPINPASRGSQKTVLNHYM